MSPLSSHNRYPPYPEPQPLPHFDGPAFSCFFVLTAAPEHVTACDCHIWSATLAICDGCDQRAFGKCVSPPCREATWRPTKRCLKTKIKTQNCGANSCLSVLLEKKCTHVQCKMMCPLLIGWFQTTCFPKQQALKSAWELRANPQIDYRTSKGRTTVFYLHDSRMNKTIYWSCWFSCWFSIFKPQIVSKTTHGTHHGQESAVGRWQNPKLSANLAASHASWYKRILPILHLSRFWHRISNMQIYWLTKRHLAIQTNGYTDTEKHKRTNTPATST